MLVVRENALVVRIVRLALPVIIVNIALKMEVVVGCASKHMRRLILFTSIYCMHIMSFGQGYLNQTRKYIIDKYSECRVSDYTDTIICIRCEVDLSEACFFFNKDGVCTYYAIEYNEEATAYLMRRLSELGYSFETIQEEKTNEVIYRYRKDFFYVDIEKSTTTKGYYLCSFY